MIELCAIASGSNGNCYYVGNENEAVLVDAGISRKQILIRMEERGLDASKIKGIFISHEHADHIRGVKVLSKVLDVPVYMTKGTFEQLWNPYRPGKYGIFTPGEALQVGDITVHPFLKKHDAANPCSFRVELEGKSVGVMTDIGEACDNVRQHLRECDAVFLESNYDEQMLEEGTYPYPLKQRVKSDVGHLSNDQAFELVQQAAGEHLEYILLSHLSGENNSPEKAMSVFEPLKKQYQVKLSSRTAPSELIKL